jgi:hypothetical protein
LGEALPLSGPPQGNAAIEIRINLFPRYGLLLFGNGAIKGPPLAKGFPQIYLDKSKMTWVI